MANKPLKKCHKNLNKHVRKNDDADVEHVVVVDQCLQSKA